MRIEHVLFTISLIFSAIIIYILGLLWFGDTRNRQSKSFFSLGIIVTFWILLNAISIISDVKFFPYIYTLRITVIAIIPFAVLWFILNFSGIHQFKPQILKFLIWLIPAVDALAMLTNPLHRLMFLDYNFPAPEGNTGFWIHTGAGLIAVAIAFIVLARHIFKHARNDPIVILTGFGILIPYFLNILYTFGFRYIPYDITPLGFFIAFIVFSFISYRSQLFNANALTLNSIYALLKDVILIVNERYMIVDANPAAAETFPDFSFSLESCSLFNFFSYLNDQGAECIPKDLLKPLEKDMVEQKGELHLRRKDGRVMTFIVTFRTIAVSKKTSGCILILSDVSIYRSMISEINLQNTRLAELMEAAQAASRAKSAFLANMSHEIRTPLNAVMGMAHIARKSAENDKTLAAIKEIETASRHLLGVLNNVLDMSKIESGKFELVSETFSLQKAMNEVTELITPRCIEKNIKINSDFKNLEGRQIIGDKLRLKQILINLLGNAVKFTPEKGNILFGISLLEESEDAIKVNFVITDSGIGMSDEQISRLFEAFSQADSGIFNRFGGTGLGLSISQNLTQLMGGKISVKSSPGNGSSFEFTLNFQKGSQSSRLIETQYGEMIPDLSGKHILLVEDIEINRIILSELLADTNVEIDEAEDGEKAIAVFSGKKPFYYDLIFMDVQMPELDGYETTRRIRSMDRPDAGNIPIIAMTANAYKEDIEKAFSSGMNEHLAKPIDPKAVMQILAEKLGN